METFHFDLVTPESAFFSGDVEMVEAPGALGDFGVLAGHMPFVSALKSGPVTVHEGESRIFRIFICGGVAEVNPGACTILAEQIVDLSALTPSDAEARLAKARLELDNAFDDDDRLVAAREVEMAEAIVEAVA